MSKHQRVVMGVLVFGLALFCAVGVYASDENLVTGPIPEATVSLQGYDRQDEATLTPDTLIITDGYCGAVYTEEKLLHLPQGVTPAKGDILICFDLTGSMGGELNNVKVNAINIMNAVRAVIPDTRFGVISHMDYDGEHGGCDYSATYGDAAGSGDYPYSLDQVLTADTSAVAAAINGLTLGYGADGPEDYTRALYESYADAAIDWRDGAKKIVLQWGDANPHDCAYDACEGGSSSSGPDPGRDETDGTLDDLEILPVLNDMADQAITLLALHSGGFLSLWDCYAAVTGGQAFEINPDGTIPGGEDIADYIASIIGEQVAHIDAMTLEVCTAGYENWLVSVDPTEYTDLDLSEPLDLPFTIILTVPEDTPAGDHMFYICAIGDAAEYARQCVSIMVQEASATERRSWGEVKNRFE